MFIKHDGLCVDNDECSLKMMDFVLKMTNHSNFAETLLSEAIGNLNTNGIYKDVSFAPKGPLPHEHGVLNYTASA